MWLFFFFFFEKFWNHLNWLKWGSQCDYDHSFFKGLTVTWLFFAFIRPRVLMLRLQGNCLIWLMLKRWDGSLLYLSVRAAAGLQHSASAAQRRRFNRNHTFTFPALCFRLPPGSQYITCKLQNCSDGNRGKPFPGFIIPNSLVVQDEYVFIQVGFFYCMVWLH